MTLEEELKERYEHWNYLKQHGGQDPFWEDGSNMNLVRNHIINIKRKMEEKDTQLELFNKEIPPEVDNKYMARADEIRKNAKRALAEYKASKDYQYLLKAIGRLNDRQREQTSINYVVGYCRGLESYIKSDDLVAMRRHESYERYLKSFYECKKKVENVLKEKEKPGEQISIMDFA